LLSLLSRVVIVVIAGSYRCYRPRTNRPRTGGLSWCSKKGGAPLTWPPIQNPPGGGPLAEEGRKLTFACDVASWQELS
jgi:hypothetical protein